MGFDIVGAPKVASAAAAAGTSDKLSDISLVCYDLPKSITGAMPAVLASGVVYQYWYTSFIGQLIEDEDGTNATNTCIY